MNNPLDVKENYEHALDFAFFPLKLWIAPSMRRDHLRASANRRTTQAEVLDAPRVQLP
jgi:hypothetical protein